MSLFFWLQKRGPFAHDVLKTTKIGKTLQQLPKSSSYSMVKEEAYLMQAIQQSETNISFCTGHFHFVAERSLFVLQRYLRPKLCDSVNSQTSGGSRSVNRSDLNCFGVLIPLFLMAVHALAILSNSVRPEGITDLVFHALGIFC